MSSAIKGKNKYPIICENDRMAIVGAIRYVDKVVPYCVLFYIRVVPCYIADDNECRKG